MNKIFLYILIGSCFFTCTDNAFAYLDPGTGSMILQAVLGTFLFVGTAIGIFWQKIKNFFSKSKEEENE